MGAFFVGLDELGYCVNWVSSLIVLLILDRIWVVWAMLQLCRVWMQLFGKVGRHCYLDILFIVVPCKRDTTIEIALPIFDNLIRFRPKGSKEMLEVFVTNVFDAKVVHAQVEPVGS